MKDQLRDIIIILLLAAMVFLGIRTIGAYRYEGEEKGQYVRKMTAECNDAVQSVEVLSTYNGSKTALTLAKIRSQLSTIQALNDTFNQQRKRLLVSDELISECISIVDRFLDDSSQGGLNQTVVLADLRIAINQLKTELNELN